MTWVERQLGIDGVDLTIHAALTFIGIAVAYQVFPTSFGPVLALKISAASLLVFAWRRHRGLRRLAEASEVGLGTGPVGSVRLEDIEQRLAELESAQARVAELEERLDFAERLLAKQPADLLLAPGQSVKSRADG